MKNLFPIRKKRQIKTWITSKSNLVNQWVYWGYFQEQEWMSQTPPPQHGWQTAHESWNPIQPTGSMVGWRVLWESSVGLSFFQMMLPPGQLLWEWLSAVFTAHISMQRECLMNLASFMDFQKQFWFFTPWTKAASAQAGGSFHLRVNC